MRPESPSQPPAPKHSGVFAASAVCANEAGLTAALEHDLRDSLDAARAARAAATENASIGGVIRDLYARLQTPLFPKNANRDFFSALQTTPNKVTLRVVLGSPTALRELPHFLECIATLQQRRIEVDARFTVVRWEELSDARRESPHARNLHFEAVVHTVRESVHEAGFSKDAVVAIDVELNARTGQIASPPDFKDWSDQAQDAADAAGLSDNDASSRHVEKDLARDVEWITEFFRRDDSSREREPEQRLIDIAIRRAVAVRIANEFDARPADEDHAFAIMTSERTRRLIKCYRPEIPVLNVATDPEHAYSVAS